jgi:hypothetical protein
VCLSQVYSIFKKISPKTFELFCLCISSSATHYTFPLVYKLFEGNGINSCCVRRQSCTASWTSSSVSPQTLIASMRDPKIWKSERGRSGLYTGWSRTYQFCICRVIINGQQYEGMHCLVTKFTLWKSSFLFGENGWLQFIVQPLGILGTC